MGNSSSISNGSSTAAPRMDGEEDRISNKRKRSCDGNNADNVVSTGLLSMIGQPLFGMLDSPNDDPSLSTMPDSVLLHTFSFILSLQGDCWGDVEKSLTTQLALEKTCRRLHSVLGQDATMMFLYSNPQPQPRWFLPPLKREFSYQTDSLREEIFIRKGLRMIRKYQVGRHTKDNLICKYTDRANGLRHIIDKILVQMEKTVPGEAVGRDAAVGQHGALMPLEFPQNGFKVFLRGDSIAYLTGVVEQHMIQKLTNAMNLAIFRSRPAESHPYPTVSPDDLVFVEAMRTDFELHCCVVGRHQTQQRHICQKLSLGSTPKKWVWPENDCMDDEIIGTKTMQRLVRAIAFRAGIVKLSGPAFECIAAEILHFLAVIVIEAFETSKSLWCQEADVGRMRTPSGLVNQAIADDIICDLSKCTFLSSSEDSIHSENSHDSKYCFYLDILFNYPPPIEVDEDGKYVCVIIPRQIKDAAVRLGMKPLANELDVDGIGWVVREGFTMEEEVEDALSKYGLSLDDESSMSEADSDSSMAVDSNETGEDDSFKFISTFYEKRKKMNTIFLLSNLTKNYIFSKQTWYISFFFIL